MSNTRSRRPRTSSTKWPRMTTRIKTPEQIEAKRKATRKRLLEDFEFYAPRALKIRTKDAKIVPFRLNRAQRRLLDAVIRQWRSEEHTSELQSLMLISYAVFCLKKNKITTTH